MVKPTLAQLARFVGNPDAYAIQKDNGDYYPVREKLTKQVLSRHLRKEITIGSYLVWGSKSRTLCLDFDSGDDAAPQARKVGSALHDLGIPDRCVGMEFSGSKGYHLWVVMPVAVEASELRKLGKAALGMAGVPGEVYPKQDYVRDLGNLVKLPGSMHRKTGAENNFVDWVPMPLATSIFKRALSQIPDDAIKKNSGKSPVKLECIANIFDGADAGWRNHALFQLATHFRRNGLSSDEALLAVLATANQNFNPPCDEAELLQVMESSKNSGPICSQLPEEAQCSECPYRQSTLFVREGQIKHAVEGERIVVEIGKRRSSGAIEILHPDLKHPAIA